VSWFEIKTRKESKEESAEEELSANVIDFAVYKVQIEEKIRISGDFIDPFYRILDRLN